MSPAPAPASRSSYWQLSRSPRYSLSFALPLLALYEVLAAAVNHGSTGVRNGADVILKSFFARLLGPRGPLIFGILLVATLVAFIVRDMRRHPGGLRPSVFARMLAESAALALVFGVVVGLITAQLVGAMQRLALGPLDGLSPTAAVMIALGAGLYEELLFRVVLVSLLLLGARYVFGLGRVASNIFAVIGSAVVFSAFHYLGPFGDRPELGSFVFRAVAGLAFSALYVWRGFGITAWTHALYDIFLMAARG